LNGATALTLRRNIYMKSGSKQRLAEKNCKKRKGNAGSRQVKYKKLVKE
jgi:hypothetical protein